MHVLSLSPHTSHKTKPLAVSFYRPLGGTFNKESDKFMRASAHKKITPYDVYSIINEAYSSTATIQKRVSGFRRTGILPINRGNFPEEAFFSVQTLQPVIVDDQDNVNTELPEQVDVYAVLQDQSRHPKSYAKFPKQ